MSERKPVCVVVGVGPGNGAALARRFAAGGYAVALLARSTELTSGLAAELGDARAYACDVTDDAAIVAVFAQIAAELGPVDALVYNAGAGTWGNVETITAAQLDQAFAINARGALVAAQQVIPAMKARGAGDILFIGATASRRGNVQTAGRTACPGRGRCCPGPDHRRRGRPAAGQRPRALARGSSLTDDDRSASVRAS